MQVCNEGRFRILLITRPRLAGGGINTEHRAHGLMGSCLDLASPSRGSLAAALNCSLSAGWTLPFGRERRAIIIATIMTQVHC